MSEEEKKNNFEQFLNKRVIIFFKVRDNKIFNYRGVLVSTDGHSVVIDDKIIGRTLISINSVVQMKELKNHES